jgi:hypothetical protein
MKKIKGIPEAEYFKAYREANKDKIAEQNKAYYEANKDKFKAYYEANKDKIKAYYEARRKMWESLSNEEQLRLMNEKTKEILSNQSPNSQTSPNGDFSKEKEHNISLKDNSNELSQISSKDETSLNNNIQGLTPKFPRSFVSDEQLNSGGLK